MQAGLRRLGELPVQLRDKPRHLFLERLAVVFDIFRADVAAGREDEAVGGDFLEGRRFAEAGKVGVIGGAAFPFWKVPVIFSKSSAVKARRTRSIM